MRGRLGLGVLYFVLLFVVGISKRNRRSIPENISAVLGEANLAQMREADGRLCTD